MSPSPTTDLQALLQRQAAALERVVRRYVDDEAERDDLRQEIAIALWKAMPRFRGESSEEGYVLRIARNKAVDHCVARARWRSLLGEVTPGAAPLPHGTTPDPQDRVQLAELRNRLQSALGLLPPTQRECVTLAAAGWSPAEIGEHRGCSANSVRVNLHRARAALRTIIGDGRGTE